MDEDGYGLYRPLVTVAGYENSGQYDTGSFKGFRRGLSLSAKRMQDMPAIPSVGQSPSLLEPRGI